jgi:hypothetical protein
LSSEIQIEQNSPMSSQLSAPGLLKDKRREC